MLRAEGVPVWRDTDSLLGGDNWRDKIREAITRDALVFIACFSSRSAARRKSYQYVELRLAINEYWERRPGDPWLIPVAFDYCQPPDFDLGGGERFTSLHRVDLFGDGADRRRAQVVARVCQLLGIDSDAGPPAVQTAVPSTASPDRATHPALTRRTLLVTAGLFAAGAVTWALADSGNAVPGARPRNAATGRTRMLSPETSTTGPGTTTSSSDANTPSATALSVTAAPEGGPIDGNGGTVYSVAFSADGRTLASGSGDWNTRLWNVASPAHPVLLGKPLTGHGDIVYSVAFSPDGGILASGSADSLVLLWNVANPAYPTLLTPTEEGAYAFAAIHSVAFSPNGHTMAVGSETTYPQDEDMPIYLWLFNVANPGRPVAVSQPSGNTGAVYSVAFSPDGRIMAAGSADETIRLWTVTNPVKPVAAGQPLTGDTGAVYSVAFSPDGRILASGSADRTIRLWDMTDQDGPVPVGQPLIGHSSYVYSVAFSPDGRILASGSADETIRLWDVTNPTQAVPLGQPLTGHQGDVLSVAFRPDGSILASGSDDQTIRLWKIG